ncbi:hypothetical protein M9H77_23791 [Catharanthus roseus]|uniref:Uncharacterized protein n=1 Tax=Catharanthus roseus TaxID=4058 RepID=A0ACC0AU11_CATRO|nr:hypothetical protein M9H77_23791 [Catharanthus roseus]
MLKQANHSIIALIPKTQQVSGTIWDTVIRKDFSPLMKLLLMIRDAILEAEVTVDEATTRISTWASGGTLWIADACTFFSHHEQKLSWTKIVWNVTFPLKFSFILWLVVLERLPTLDRLTFLDVDRTWKLCNQQEESLSHLFCTSGLRQRSMVAIQNCLVRLKWDCRGTSWICHFKKLSFAATLYYIWECRNKVVFEQYSPDRNHIISKIKIQVYKVIYAFD